MVLFFGFFNAGLSSFAEGSEAVAEAPEFPTRRCTFVLRPQGPPQSPRQDVSKTFLSRGQPAQLTEGWCRVIIAVACAPAAISRPLFDLLAEAKKGHVWLDPKENRSGKSTLYPLQLRTIVDIDTSKSAGLIRAQKYIKEDATWPSGFEKAQAHCRGKRRGKRPAACGRHGQPCLLGQGVKNWNLHDVLVGKSVGGVVGRGRQLALHGTSVQRRHRVQLNHQQTVGSHVRRPLQQMFLQTLLDVAKLQTLASERKRPDDMGLSGRSMIGALYTRLWSRNDLTLSKSPRRTPCNSNKSKAN